jgi:hypothetical protein
MSKAKQWLGSAALVLAAAGCSTTSVTNLTPGTLPRNPDGLYPFEASWDSTRRGVGTNVHAYVVIETNLYPMMHVPLTRDRWEAQVPIKGDASYVPYRFKFDFGYPGVGVQLLNSDLSPSYRLTITEKP